MDGTGHMKPDRREVVRAEAIRITFAVVVAVVVILLSGGTVEIVNHTGIVSGLGFGEQIARAIVDTGTFAVTATVLWQSWRHRR